MNYINARAYSPNLDVIIVLFITLQMLGLKNDLPWNIRIIEELLDGEGIPTLDANGRELTLFNNFSYYSTPLVTFDNMDTVIERILKEVRKTKWL